MKNEHDKEGPTETVERLYEKAKLFRQRVAKLLETTYRQEGLADVVNFGVFDYQGSRTRDFFVLEDKHGKGHYDVTLAIAAAADGQEGSGYMMDMYFTPKNGDPAIETNMVSALMGKIFKFYAKYARSKILNGEKVPKFKTSLNLRPLYASGDMDWDPCYSDDPEAPNKRPHLVAACDDLDFLKDLLEKGMLVKKKAASRVGLS